MSGLSAESPKGREERVAPRWSARQIAVMALFTALGTILSFIELPLIPGPAAFLKFDPANVPAILGALAFGPGAGIVIGVLTSAIHGVFAGGDFSGAFMNSCVVVIAIVPIALICRRKTTSARLIIALGLGAILAAAIMIPLNLLITSQFYGMDAVISLIVPALIPFNLAKAAINAVLTFILYKSIGRFLIREEA
jgi:riboflavin transporter FmnP